MFKTLKEKPNISKLFLKPAIATVIMGIYIIFTKNIIYKMNIGNTMGTLIIIFTAAIIYFIALILMKTMDENEVKQLPMGNILVKFKEKIAKS